MIAIAHAYYFDNIRSFIRMPRFLFSEKALKGLSNDSKLLYTLILERASLSDAKGYRDALGRVIIYFPMEKMTSVLNCSELQANEYLNELEACNLISRDDKINNPSKIAPLTVI